jgi:hypothetical protein
VVSLHRNTLVSLPRNWWSACAGIRWSGSSESPLYYLKDAKNQHTKDTTDYRNDKTKAVTELIKFATKNSKILAQVKLDDIGYPDYFIARRRLHVLLDSVKEFFPEELDTTDMNKVQRFVNALNDQERQKRLITYVTQLYEGKLLDSLQNSAPFTHFRYGWLTLTPKVNHKDDPIYAPGDAENNYTRTESEYYFSSGLSWNILWAWKKFKFMLYPGVTVQRSRVFDPADSLSININKPFISGTDTLISSKSTGFYPTLAPFKWSYNFTLPVMFYWDKGWGIDAGVAYKIKPVANDFNAHVGVFFSVAAGGGGDNITIEPLIKYDTDKSIPVTKNFDKFTLGVSVSFAIPTYISGK